MNPRPTPKTDALRDLYENYEHRATVGDIWELCEFFERELAEAREQANDMREKWLAKGQCCEYLGAELHEAIKQRDRLAVALNMYAWPCSDEELSHHCCSPSPSFSIQAQREMRRRKTLQSLPPKP